VEADGTRSTSSPTREALGSSGCPSVLTSEIFDEFGRALLASAQFNQSFVDSFLALASAEARPRPKDIEALLQQEEPLE